MPDTKDKPQVVALVNTRVIPRESPHGHASTPPTGSSEKEGLLSLLAGAFEEGAGIYESLTGKDAVKARGAAKSLRKVHIAGVKAEVLKDRIEKSNLPKIAKAVAENIQEKSEILKKHGVITSREYGK